MGERWPSSRPGRDPQAHAEIKCKGILAYYVLAPPAVNFGSTIFFAFSGLRLLPPWGISINMIRSLSESCHKLTLTTASDCPKSSVEATPPEPLPGPPILPPPSPNGDFPFLRRPAINTILACLGPYLTFFESIKKRQTI